MKTYPQRLQAVLYQCFAAAFMVGLADACLTAAYRSAPFVPTYMAVFAITTVALLAVSVVLAAIIALFARGAADQTGIPRAICGTVFPADRGKRVRRGASMLVALVLMAVFVVVSSVVGKVFVESMRTTIYATISASLASLATGLVLLAGWTGFRKWLLARNGSGARLLTGIVLSPAGVTVLAVIAAVPVVVVLWDKIDVILEALPLRVVGLLLGGAIAGAAIGIRKPFAQVPAITRLVVLAGIPIIAGGAFAVSGSGFGINNDVRIAFTSRGVLSPTAFKIARRALDFDGDGFIGIMNDGDCAQFNAAVSAGAIEIPNNSVDEDCDGEDLTFDAEVDDFFGRWDFDVPPPLRGRHYNVVMITIDAAAPDRMSLYGYRRPTTPNLRRIAASSALFTAAVAPGPSTRLAIPEMMTSKFGPQVDRAVDYRIPLEIRPSNNTMAEVMRRAGYRTNAVIPTSYFSRWRGIMQGFDKVDKSALPFDSKKNNFHSGAQVSEALVSMFRKAADDPGRPVFIWAHYYDAHQPYTPVKDGVNYGTSKPDMYDSELQFVDGEIGRVVEEMDRILDPANTILIISADHGEAFDSNHAVRHHGYDLHSTIVHVPLIIRAPFVKAGVFRGAVSTLDILPTLVNLLNIRGKFKFAGTSLVPQLVDGTDDIERQIYSLFYLPENVYHGTRTHIMAGARNSEFNYFKDLESNAEYLYNFNRDPYEERNLADEMPRRRHDFRRTISKFLLWLDGNSVKRERPRNGNERAAPGRSGAARNAQAGTGAARNANAGTGAERNTNGGAAMPPATGNLTEEAFRKAIEGGETPVRAGSGRSGAVRTGAPAAGSTRPPAQRRDRIDAPETP